MLSQKNQEQISKMLQYTRTRDMLNLLTFFPNLSPVQNLTIIKSISDYYENYEFVKDFSIKDVTL